MGGEGEESSQGSGAFTKLFVSGEKAGLERGWWVQLWAYWVWSSREASVPSCPVAVGFISLVLLRVYTGHISVGILRGHINWSHGVMTLMRYYKIRRGSRQKPWGTPVEGTMKKLPENRRKTKKKKSITVTKKQKCFKKRIIYAGPVLLRGQARWLLNSVQWSLEVVGDLSKSHLIKWWGKTPD